MRLETWKTLLGTSSTRSPHDNAANLSLLAEGDDVGFDAHVLDSPHLAGSAHAGLDFVGDQHEVVFVGQPPQFRKELRAEMIVAAFALDRFDDQRGDVVWMCVDGLLDLSDGLLLRGADFLQHLLR